MRFFFQILTKFKFFRENLLQIPNIRSHKNPFSAVGFEQFHSDWQTDRHEKAKSAFRNFTNT